MKTFVYTLIPNREVRQMFKFAIVGVCNTAIDYGAYFLFTRFFLFHILFANASAMILAMMFSFMANRNFTFRKSEGNIQSQIVRFLIVQGVGFILANTVFYLGVYAGEFDIIAKIIASVVFTTWNFLAQKYWAFR